ncbi:MAG TPA: homocysteine S-methyltransferase family protein [Planctomycetota bacterium]|nr:homocysteine S-methyltransferase family protein [Planctomycetota bacterium]
MSERLQKLAARIASGEMILGDGAWGTQLQRAGLGFGDCPEEWNVSHPDEVKRVAREYLEAGADFCLTNTFGGNRYRLTRHGFADRLREFNLAGVALSLDAARAFDAPVAASVGPTGEFVQPEGMLSEKEMRDAFREQIAVLKEGGADAICVETMYVVQEAAIAVRAAKDAGFYCMASVTLDFTGDRFKTMLGTPIERAVRALEGAGADVIGSNCGNGIAEMVIIAREMRKLTKKPLIIKSNAGVPELVNGVAVYGDTPEIMARAIKDFKDLGVSIVGGCCGTTPEHIRRFRAEIDLLKKNNGAAALLPP